MVDLWPSNMANDSEKTVSTTDLLQIYSPLFSTQPYTLGS